MTTMTVVWERGEDGLRVGDVAEHFIAIWGDENGNAHATFCHPPEWQPLADAIEKALNDFQPNRPVWEWPEVEAQEARE